jgi:hypothetical protein
VLDHQLGNIKSAQRMLNSPMRCASEYKVDLTQLVDVGEALESWVVDYSQFGTRESDLTVDWNEELLFRSCSSSKFRRCDCQLFGVTGVGLRAQASTRGAIPDRFRSHIERLVRMDVRSVFSHPMRV